MDDKTDKQSFVQIGWQGRLVCKGEGPGPWNYYTHREGDILRNARSTYQLRPVYVREEDSQNEHN